MKATQVLMDEHRVIEGVLTSLETGADRLEAGEEIRPEFFLDTAAFVKGFADGCHHVKEENVLFPSLEVHGVPVQGGPVGVMLAEHEMGRAYIRAMVDAANRLQAGDQGAREDVVRNARGYVILLRQHIAKEDSILFPLADQVIPISEQDNIWTGFEHVEHEETGEGVHEKYLALAATLQEELGQKV